MAHTRLAVIVASVALVGAACTGTSDVQEPSTSLPASTTAGATEPTTTVPATTTTAGATTTTEPPPPADMVLTDAKVVTADPEFTIAQAVAITDGDIVAVGSSDEIASLVGPDTTVVDLDGKVVLPGFIDPHTHALQLFAYLPDIDQMRAAQSDLLAGGVTTIGSPNVKPDDLSGFDMFGAASEPVIRDHLYISFNDECGDRPFGDYWREHAFSRDPDLRQTIAGVKIFTDGGVCNAPAFSVAYPDTVPQRLKDAGWVGNGSLYVSADEVADVARQTDDAGGITVIHAIGDLGIATALEGLTAASEAHPFESPVRIDHNSASSLLTPSQLAQYGDLGMVPALFPTPWANGCDPATTAAWEAILPAPVFDIIENSQALRDANPGMPVSWHGDAPSVPGHPLQIAFTLVTGGAVDIGTGEVCYPEAWSGFFTVPAEEAVRMLTINPAIAMGIEERVGSIEVGKVADLVVLDEDPLGPDPETGFARNRPLVTIVDDSVAFCDPAWCDRFPEVSDS